MGSIRTVVGRSSWPTTKNERRTSALLFQIYRLYGQIPVGVENFETALFFARVGRLIGELLFLERIFVEGLIGHGGIFEDDSYAIIPAPVFRGVVAGLVHPDLEQAAHLNFFIEQRVVIFLEELQEFIGVSPFCFVIVFDDKWLAGCGGSSLGKTKVRAQKQQR